MVASVLLRGTGRIEVVGESSTEKGRLELGLEGKDR